MNATLRRGFAQTSVRSQMAVTHTGESGMPLMSLSCGLYLVSRFMNLLHRTSHLMLIPRRLMLAVSTDLVSYLTCKKNSCSLEPLVINVALNFIVK